MDMKGGGGNGWAGWRVKGDGDLCAFPCRPSCSFLLSWFPLILHLLLFLSSLFRPLLPFPPLHPMLLLPLPHPPPFLLRLFLLHLFILSLTFAHPPPWVHLHPLPSLLPPPVPSHFPLLFPPPLSPQNWTRKTTRVRNIHRMEETTMGSTTPTEGGGRTTEGKGPKRNIAEGTRGRPEEEEEETTTMMMKMEKRTTKKMDEDGEEDEEAEGARRQFRTKMGNRHTEEEEKAGGAAVVPLAQCVSDCLLGASPSADQRASTAMAARLSTATAPYYYEYEAPEEITHFGVCNTTVLVDPVQHTVFRVLFYFSAAWVPFWAFLSTIANLAFRQFGHHRCLDSFQELGFACAFPFLGVFSLFPQLPLLCLITTMVLQFFLLFILVLAFLQAHFASSLIKGASVKNGSLPVAVFYIWPIVSASVPVAVFFLLLRHQYSSNGVHCFAPVHSDLFWSFVVPAWLLWFPILIRNQLSITACKQSRPGVDREQLYWARKSVKGIPILGVFGSCSFLPLSYLLTLPPPSSPPSVSWFLLTFFTALFALDLQLLWLAVLFLLESVVLGPLLFLLHTFNHSKVNNGMFARTELSVYRPCPLRRPPASATPPPPPPVDLLRPRHDPIVVPRHSPSSALAPPPPPPPSTTLLPSVSVPSVHVTPPAPSSSSPAALLPISPLPGTVLPSSDSQLLVPPMRSTGTYQQPSPIICSTQGQQHWQQRKVKEEEEEEEECSNSGGPREANAQQFYEWVTDRDEKGIGHSRRVLWPPLRQQQQS